VGKKAHLLHHGATISVDLLSGSLTELLVLGIDGHGDLEERLVQERNSSLESPSHGRPTTKRREDEVASV